jgi:RNA polymerase-binding transcription factor DksA
MAKSKIGKTTKKETVKTVKKVGEKNTQPKTKRVTKKVTTKTAKKISSKKVKTTLKKANEVSVTEKKKKTLSFPKSVLKNFIKLIDMKKTDLVEELESLKRASDDLNTENSIYSLHMADQGTDAHENEKHHQQIQRHYDQLKRLDDAIQRIEAGTYGICVVCNKLIEKKRLEAVPTTKKHTNCKNELKRMNAENIIISDE